MNLSYLYSNAIEYPHHKKLLEEFTNAKNINIGNSLELQESDLYIIELNDTDKEISQKLISMFKQKHHSLIYFIIPPKISLMFLQLTFLLEAKAVISHKQDIDKTISKIKNDRKQLIQNNLEQWLGNIAIKAQNFLIYKNDKLAYANEHLLLTFASDNLHVFEEKVLSQLDIQTLLDNETTINKLLIDNSSKEQNYLFKSSVASDTEKIIYIEKTNAVPKQLEFIASRIAFIELLKESMLQRDISSSKASLITINIKNIKLLLEEYDLVEFEELLLELLTFIESNLQNKRIFSQFENNFYVVFFEESSFEDINSIAEELHNKVTNFIQSKNTKVMLELFTFSLEDQELSDILATLQAIENNSLIVNDDNSFYIKRLQEHGTDAPSILKEAQNNEADIKILNIYNGLVINTKAKIIKVSDESAHIRFESLQGVILSIEKKTVLQSSTFYQDIEAEVKQIDTAKKIAILENFTFLQTNANARKYARVTTAIKIPIAINNKGTTINGTILDISIKSIAIRVKNNPSIPVVNLKSCSLVFNLPNKSSDEGYSQLNVPAEIIMTTPVDESGYYKAVCNLDQEAYQLDLILKYVYERQKELIIELKKKAKLT